MKIVKPFALCSHKIKFLLAESREKLISAQDANSNKYGI